jgi:hypothetical protein
MMKVIYFVASFIVAYFDAIVEPLEIDTRLDKLIGWANRIGSNIS